MAPSGPAGGGPQLESNGIAPRNFARMGEIKLSISPAVAARDLSVPLEERRHTLRSTATTRPSTTASSPGMGGYAGFCGSSQM